MRLVWLTDVHLNFLPPPERLRFAETVRAAMDGTAGLLITGDIGEGPEVEELLVELAARVPGPIWFVLGNHDFYRSSIAAVRERVRALTERHATLAWLPARPVVHLSGQIALVGHDGWGDARLGDYDRSRVELNDFHLIEELIGWRGDARRARLHALGDEAAAHLRSAVDRALEWARHVVVAIHVPPFREACWHEGRISGDDWLPFFTCAAAGDVLRAAMTARPDATMTVLCGHTHGGGEAAILPNLRVLTGAAEYGAPVVRALDLTHQPERR
jgi:3',5'-cyclic-AMP phosphodiesterase